MVKNPNPSLSEPSPGTMLYSTKPLVPVSKSMAERSVNTAVPMGVFSGREMV